MEWRIEGRPAYSFLHVLLNPGEEVWAEPGAFMYGRGDFEITSTSGGIMRGLLRAIAGGESFFLNRFRARSETELWFVPSLPGDIATIELNGGSWIVQDTSYLAHYGDLEVGVAWRGLRGLIAEGELVWLRLSGYGLLWVSSYGEIRVITVPAGESIIVDNFHFVAMPADTHYEITKLGGLKTFLFGGEGFVIRVWGPTTVYVQTRTLPLFARLIAKYMPKS